MKTIRSIKLSDEEDKAVQVEANRRGVTASEIVALSIRAYLGLGDDIATTLCDAVASYVATKYDPTDFQSDVTRQVFLYIRDDSRLREMYSLAVAPAGRGGDDDPKKVWALNKRIGKRICRVLHADVMGRTVKPLPSDELIKWHSYLVPGKKKK